MSNRDGWKGLVQKAQVEVLEQGLDNVDIKTVLLASAGETREGFRSISDNLEATQRDVKFLKRVFAPVIFLGIALIANVVVQLFTLLSG